MGQAEACPARVGAGLDLMAYHMSQGGPGQRRGIPYSRW